MKCILASIMALILSIPILAQEKDSNEVPGKFHISKVNRIEKLWIVPPDRRGFMGSRGIRKFDYTRPIRYENQGEDYVISWRYKGKQLTGDLMLKFEYRTVNDFKEPYVEEYTWHGIKRSSYKWTFKNRGGDFSKKGKIDRWKASLIYKGKVVAEKRSATWQAMEGS